MIRVAVLGASVWAPGLPGWEASRAVLTGGALRDPGASLMPPPPAILSPTERRRASLAVRLALAVAQEAVAQSGVAPTGLRAVFGSANGDGAVIHAILDSLTKGDGQVSPTQFHNSVHNAASGYWSIGTATRQPATCIGCHDFTAGTALLAAAVEAQAEAAPVLLCVYDVPMPPPLDRLRLTAEPFAAALVLAPPGAGMATLDLSLGPEGDPVPPGMNTAALLLPLLECLARGVTGFIPIPILDCSVEVGVEPCSPARKSPH